jgi:hypothetical protein
VDHQAGVTVYVTLFAAGNAVSLSQDDSSNSARIRIVDRAVASGAVDHAWLRASWLGDPRNSDDGTNLNLVSSLAMASSPSDAFEASVQAYLDFLPAESSVVTVIDSALDDYAYGFETEQRSLSTFISDVPSEATMQCVDQVMVDSGVAGYNFTFSSKFGRSTVELAAADAETSKARLESLPCFAAMQEVGITVAGR